MNLRLGDALIVLGEIVAAILMWNAYEGLSPVVCYEVFCSSLGAIQRLKS
jgi:hypothetical protein